MKVMSTLSMGRRCLITACCAFAGIFIEPSVVFSQCVRSQIQPNDAVVGNLSFSDCTRAGLLLGADFRFVDLYTFTMPISGSLTVRMGSNDFDALALLMDPTLTRQFALDDDSGGSFNALFSVHLEPGNYTILATSASANPDTGGYTLTTNCCTSHLAASVLPSSRSVQVGEPASAFATVINTLTTVASNCGISAPISRVSASFSYQTTDPATNALIGTRDTPVDIAPGKFQSYVFSFTPESAFNSTDVQLSFGCDNTNPAPVTVGLNTLLLSASDFPVPDVVALAATPTNDGTLRLPGTADTNAFAVATVNVGASGTITATLDTGSASLPLVMNICETDPLTAACISPPAFSVTTTIAANATPTFSIFVEGNGIVPFDPTNNRIFLRFKDDSGVTRGSTSVAVRTF